MRASPVPVQARPEGVADMAAVAVLTSRDAALVVDLQACFCAIFFSFLESALKEAIRSHLSRGGGNARRTRQVESDV